MARFALRPVDKLEVCVVVDNVLDLLSTVPQSVTPELPNLIAAGATELSGACSCCAAWGLSLLIRTHVGDERRTILFDAGPEGDTLRANARKLGLDFAELFDPVPVHGIVGGLHLSGAANEQWIDATIDDLARFRLGRIVPAHCTGYRAVHRLMDRFRETVIPSAVGQIHRI